MLHVNLQGVSMPVLEEQKHLSICLLNFSVTNRRKLVAIIGTKTEVKARAERPETKIDGKTQQDI